MSKTLECRHGGVLCGAKIRGETDEEVLRKAVEHAKTAHGVDLSQSRTLERYARSLIRAEA
jgi:predicted small metal-binding protein